MKDKVLKMFKSGFNINSIAIANGITSAEVQAICHEANFGGMGLKTQKVPAGLDKDALLEGPHLGPRHRTAGFDRHAK